MSFSYQCSGLMGKFNIVISKTFILYVQLNYHSKSITYQPDSGCSGTNCILFPTKVIYRYPINMTDSCFSINNYQQIVHVSKYHPVTMHTLLFDHSTINIRMYHTEFELKKSIFRPKFSSHIITFNIRAVFVIPLEPNSTQNIVNFSSMRIKCEFMWNLLLHFGQ